MENSDVILVRVIRDIAITIAAVLVIISMVHYDKYGAGFYLGLPITNDGNTNRTSIYRNGKEGFVVDNRTTDEVSIDYIDIRHKNSCVNGQYFR